MQKKGFLTFLLFFLFSQLYAQNLAQTTISFNIDDNQNINPTIFIPLYYGKDKQFYSAIGYLSSNTQNVEKIDKFSESKNAYISNTKELTLNFLSYQSKVFNYKTSVGILTKFIDRVNNEFGYIHDKENIFNHSTDYYISFDNEIKIDIQSYAIDADIIIPLGKYFSSRIGMSISPYTTLRVKQSTLFKPLIKEIGTSSGSSMQKIAYSLRYDALIKTDTFFNIGFMASYTHRSLKYDIAQLEYINDSYQFEKNTIDTEETTLKYVVKLLLNREMMGGLKPSIGYGIESFSIKDNLTQKTSSVDKKIVVFGVEKSF